MGHILEATYGEQVYILGWGREGLGCYHSQVKNSGLLARIFVV